MIKKRGRKERTGSDRFLIRCGNEKDEEEEWMKGVRNIKKIRCVWTLPLTVCGENCIHVV